LQLDHLDLVFVLGIFMLFIDQGNSLKAVKFSEKVRDLKLQGLMIDTQEQFCYFLNALFT
jgi:hypothetical protein